MASHGVSWVPSVHVRFRSLDFFFTTEGEPAWAPVAVQLLRSTILNATVEPIEELRLHALKAHGPWSDQLLGFDYGKLER